MLGDAAGSADAAGRSKPAEALLMVAAFGADPLIDDGTILVLGNLLPVAHHMFLTGEAGNIFGGCGDGQRCGERHCGNQNHHTFHLSDILSKWVFRD